MKESRAWKIVAEEHDARRTNDSFLCNIIQFGRGFNPMIERIPLKVRGKMIERIYSALDFGYAAAYRDMDPDTRDARILACLMFSHIAADEEGAQ